MSTFNFLRWQPPAVPAIFDGLPCPPEGSTPDFFHQNDRKGCTLDYLEGHFLFLGGGGERENFSRGTTLGKKMVNDISDQCSLNRKSRVKYLTSSCRTFPISLNTLQCHHGFSKVTVSLCYHEISFSFIRPFYLLLQLVQQYEHYS